MIHFVIKVIWLETVKNEYKDFSALPFVCFPFWHFGYEPSNLDLYYLQIHVFSFLEE